MAEFTSYARGVPCWIDLATSDPAGAREFYGAVFGWDYEIDPDPGTGHYAQAFLRGKRVAGLGGEPAPDGMPTAWTTYLASEDAEADTARIAEAGGTIVMPPMQIREQGSFAIAMDPTGAAFGLWQAGLHTGAELANEPGTLTWNDLQSRDWKQAQDFYAAVFGYDYEDVGSGEFEYKTFHVGGQAVGGMMPMPDEVPVEVPSYWGLAFAVADADVTAARITELGGQLLGPPMDSEWGRNIMATDPQGAQFGVNGPVSTA